MAAKKNREHKTLGYKKDFAAAFNFHFVMTSVIPKSLCIVKSKRIAEDCMDNKVFYLKYKKDHEKKPLEIGEEYIKKMYSEIYTLVHGLKIKHLQVKSNKRHHFLSAKYIATVLTTLPFLYCDKEFEDYQWKKLAYDLGNADELIPDLVRYQLGPKYFISFGSITNQLKREFFKLFATNYKSYKHPDSFSDNYHNSPVTCRKECVNEDFEYFTTEEIKHLIINGDRVVCEFTQSDIPDKDPATKDWYHHWGYVYETNKDSLRAIELEIGNYHLELSFLQDLLELRLGYFYVGSTNISLSQLILQKINHINTVYLPQSQALRDEKLKQLNSTKPFSLKFYHILHY